jgi:hypothetical protein
MKKLIFIIIISNLFNNLSFAESYYFKSCRISNAVTGNYIINFEENVIEVELKASDGRVQNFSDKINSIEKKQIVSDKIRSEKEDNTFYQYFLNKKKKSITKLVFKKEDLDIDVFRLKSKTESFCTDIKGDWDKRKIDKEKLKKEEKEILEAQEKIKKEQSALVKCQSDDYNSWNNCTGSFVSNSGHKYNGIFKLGEIIKGISLYPGGSKYVGTFKNMVPHGYGTFVWTNRDKYFGGWIDGKSEGDGTKMWNNGRKYIGEFKNDELHGSGTLFYPDGKKYSGEYKSGKRHGQGTFTYADGSAYIGNFINGKEDGTGACINKEGIKYPCNSKVEVKEKKNYAGMNIRKISIEAKKRVRLSQYESDSGKGKKIMQRLKDDFDNQAQELCLKEGNFRIIEKKIEVLEVDDTPSYGLEPVLRLGIEGVVECKK